MKIITALENPKTNEKLKEETNFETIGNDIQYQEGVIEILENNLKINLIIISELLPGEIGFKKIIEKIKLINKEIEIIAILKDENEELKNYLISKGVFNIFYNNKITISELIKTINNIFNLKKEKEINKEIENLKKIILENNKPSKKTLNKNIKNKYLKIKNKILNKIKSKNKIKLGKPFTSSEALFLGSIGKFRKNYLKTIEKQEFENKIKNKLVLK